MAAEYLELYGEHYAGDECPRLYDLGTPGGWARAIAVAASHKPLFRGIASYGIAGLTLPGISNEVYDQLDEFNSLEGKKNKPALRLELPSTFNPNSFPTETIVRLHVRTEEVHLPGLSERALLAVSSDEPEFSGAFAKDASTVAVDKKYLGMVCDAPIGSDRFVVLFQEKEDEDGEYYLSTSTTFITEPARLGQWAHRKVRIPYPRDISYDVFIRSTAVEILKAGIMVSQPELARAMQTNPQAI